MISPYDLHFVRHAPVVTSGVCYGHHDVAVRTDANGAAEIVLGHVATRGVRVVHTSPLARCAEPATLIARALDAELVVDARLAELSMGRWEGRTWDDIERDDGDAYRHWMAHWRELGPPGGETTNDLLFRVSAWWNEIAPDATHLLVAHAGVVRALLVSARGYSWDQAFERAVPHLELALFSAFAAPSAAPARTPEAS